MTRKPPTYGDLFDPLLTEDLEEFLARFQQKDSVRYEDFSAIWREMRFSDIFLGISSRSDQRGFCKVALATAAKYFLPPYSYQIRVGGLYLMFALYHKQLFEPPVSIRLALRDWDHVQTFLSESMESGHYDVVYIYQKLVFSKAFHFTAMPQVLTFQKTRKPKRQDVCTEFVGRTTAVQDLLSVNILEEVRNVEGLYQTLKQATGLGSQAAMTHPDFTSRLTNTLSEFVSWQQRRFPPLASKKAPRQEMKEEEKSESSSKRTRQQRSSRVTSQPRRHVEESAPVETRRKKHLSLRARTWKNLGGPQ